MFPIDGLFSGSGAIALFLQISVSSSKIKEVLKLEIYYFNSFRGENGIANLLKWFNVARIKNMYIFENNDIIFVAIKSLFCPNQKLNLTITLQYLEICSIEITYTSTTLECIKNKIFLGGTAIEFIAWTC